ncbi:hypothetical protein BGZ61DRAFT_487214 [Ilyonectria robusta]|uniref:uncharacterized protein n=1 Tax=Ilyonectria robusta TaxID=1079257 RepID=UPI001E8DDA72|nr:uncharacterized protein BGZ61DRAFT_487214 [Ilyonectria robusta]KAH8654182.1 hypothetical protein BGZ61DRAFT_487214 [Ilyonectria robusta]
MEAGICVMGSEIDLAPFLVEHWKVLSVGEPVKDVLITGFQVSNFSGANIAVVGAQNARVTGNRLINGQLYGFLTAGSTNTRVVDSTVVSSMKLGFIGICVDDMAGVQASNNYISEYNVALYIQTPGANVQYNNISDSCIGVFVDPSVDSVMVSHNYISVINSSC